MEHSRQLSGGCLRSSYALVRRQLQAHRDRGKIDAVLILPSIGVLNQVPIYLSIRNLWSGSCPRPSLCHESTFDSQCR
jgi:hypothetical protein